jgi:BirA family biotin operon repressor/biotin-[acetyl-CoA-carboxylase] ligase
MERGLSLEAVRSQLRTSSLGRRLVYRCTVASTMDVARAEAEGGTPHGTCVLADEQTAGRGRLGRPWVSPPGSNIYVSVVLRPAAAHLRQLGIVCPLAVCEAVQEMTGLAARIKWPNDVLMAGGKVAGVLIEVEHRADQVDYAVAGIGVNVNFDPRAHEEIRDVASSLMRELGREVSREAVLAALLNHLEALYEAAVRGEAPYLAWKERLDTLGRSVRVRFADRMEEGVAIDADANGALVLRRDDGSTVHIEAGDVTLRPD